MKTRSQSLPESKSKNGPLPSTGINGVKKKSKKPPVNLTGRQRGKTSSPKGGSQSAPVSEISQGKVPARKPPKFSWVVHGLLAGHGRPAQHGHVQYLCDAGFSVLVSLTENKPRAVREYPGEGLEWKHIPVKDEKPPSVDQASEFVSLVDAAEKQGEKLSVHCAWGRGRTGTFLACYLAKRDGLSASRAISRVRELRPGSIDTSQQEQTVHDYVSSLQRR